MADSDSETLPDSLNMMDSDTFQEFWQDSVSLLNSFNTISGVELANWDEALTSVALQQNNVSTTSDPLIPVVKQEEPSQEHSHLTLLPANNNWEGPYGFNISFLQQQKTTKSASWTYSEMIDKLYVTMDTPCPIRFHATMPPPPATFIRCMAIYSEPEHAEAVVERCFHHSRPDDPTNQGHTAPSHLVRCDHNGAVFHIDDSTKRHYVMVPYKVPEEGINYTVYLYKFMCRSSCVGGLNRRPVQLIFTLIHNNQCIGRRTISLRICACPGRDKKIDETNAQKQQEAQHAQPSKKAKQQQEGGPSRKKLKIVEKEEEIFTIQVKGRKMFDILTGIKNHLEKIEKKSY